MSEREAKRERLEETGRLGRELMRDKVAPALAPGDRDKFVAIDTRTGEYEVDADDHTAIKRLRARLPGAVSWLERVGHETAYQMGGIR